MFEDERTEASVALLRRVAADGAVVPGLWRLEVANGLLSALRRKRITADYRDAAVADLDALDLAVDAETDRRAWAETLRLAERWGLSAYDASYLELARRRALPLASLDAKLRAAASSLGTEVLGAA